MRSRGGRGGAEAANFKRCSSEAARSSGVQCSLDRAGQGSIEHCAAVRCRAGQGRAGQGGERAGMQWRAIAYPVQVGEVDFIHKDLKQAELLICTQKLTDVEEERKAFSASVACLLEDSSQNCGPEPPDNTNKARMASSQRRG